MTTVGRLKRSQAHPGFPCGDGSVPEPYSLPLPSHPQAAPPSPSPPTRPSRDTPPVTRSKRPTSPRSPVSPSAIPPQLCPPAVG